MATLTEIVQFYVAREAASIHTLKTEAAAQAGHISPHHPNWPAYRRAKHRASLMLTARLLVKLGAGEVPSLDAVRQARREGRLSHHAGRGRRAVSHVASAYRALRKLANRAEHAPERFADVDAWAAARHAEARAVEP